MIYALLALAAAAAAYQILAAFACVRHLRSKELKPTAFPPVSILKPVRGLDPHFYEGIRSHAVQEYPEYEILFGVSDPQDPAISEIDRLAAEYPNVPIRLIVSSTRALNRKVGVLADLAQAARHPVLLVNDSDIRVERNYLARIVRPLEDPAVGMVTCLYRGEAEGLAARFESIGISTDFAPSVLVAPLVGVSEFALGSTMLFRAADLRRIGGFSVLNDYLADDYQLSKHIRDLGLRTVISKLVVTTCLPDHSWREAWRHQLRWARTIRVSRGDGYVGIPITHASVWAALIGFAGHWQLGAALVVLRILSGVFAARAVLADMQISRDWLLIPVRDFWGLTVWAAGLFGNTVEWRGRRLRLNREGRILPLN